MTDSAFLLSVLNDGRWHSNTEILQASQAERGCGLTVHSRAADLRKRGYTIEVDVRGGGRRTSFYRLVGALEDAAGAEALPTSATAASSSASNDGALGETAASSATGAATDTGHGSSCAALSPSASTPAPLEESHDETPSRKGALQLFAVPRGAYEDAA